MTRLGDVLKALAGVREEIDGMETKVYRIGLEDGLYAFDYSNNLVDYMPIGVTATDEVQFYRNLYAPDVNRFKSTLFTLPEELAPKVTVSGLVLTATQNSPTGAFTDQNIGSFRFTAKGACGLLPFDAFYPNVVRLAGLTINIGSRRC